MSDYSQTTDFSAKDDLLTGNPSKLIKGSEFDVEFAAISTAIASKYDSSDLGVSVQAYDAGLADIAGLAVTDGNIIVGDGANWVAESGATARTSLGLAIGTDVQAYDADLAAIAALANTDGNFIVGNGSAWVAESGATARTSLGLGNVENTALSTWAGSANITTLGTVTSGDVDALLSAASTTVSGIAELATTAETYAGTDAGRVVTPDGLAGMIGAMKVSSWGTSNTILSQGGLLESATVADGDQTGEATVTTGITMTDANNLVIVATADHVADPGADAIKCNIEFVTTTTFSINVYGASDTAEDGHTVHIMVFRVGA